MNTAGVSLLRFSVVFLLLFAGCHSAAPDRTLVVGMELSYPPFETTDEAGQPAGLSVDLARDLAAALGRPLRIENIPFHGLIASLRTGKIHLILSSLTATAERRESIDFSDPYFHGGLSMLAGAKSDIQSAADLQKPGRIIAVKKGTTGEIYTTQKLPRATVRVFDQDNVCALEVAQGKAEVFLYDQFSTLRYWQQNKTTTRAILQPITAEQWAMGLRKDDPELRNQVNAFLAKYQQDGGFERLGDKWLHEEKKAFAELGVPFVF